MKGMHRPRCEIVGWMIKCRLLQVGLLKAMASTLLITSRTMAITKVCMNNNVSAEGRFEQIQCSIF